MWSSCLKKEKELKVDLRGLEKAEFGKEMPDEVTALPPGRIQSSL